MIPAEAVEALARRNYEAEWGDGWDGVIDQIKRGWLNEARAQCEAAAPHMLAGVYALMEDPEHYDSQGPSNGYVSVDNLRAALRPAP